MLFFAGLFWFFHDLLQRLQHIKSICYIFSWSNLLLFICLLLNQYMIHHDLDLFYDIYDKINDTIKDKVATSHWCFQSNMISIKKWCKKAFHNFICVIINQTFYFITLWMHYTLFISVFRRNEIYCYSQLKFLCIRFFWTIYVFQVWSTFIKIFLNW